MIETMIGYTGLLSSPNIKCAAAILEDESVQEGGWYCGGQWLESGSMRRLTHKVCTNRCTHNQDSVIKHYENISTIQIDLVQCATRFKEAS